MDDMISRQAAIDIFNQKMKEMPPERYADYYKGLMVANGVVQGLPSVQPEERTKERTETHACDCISRQDAIALVEEVETKRLIGQIELTYAPMLKGLQKLPSVQPDLSDYSDRLWKAAYERGRAEAMQWIPCSECGRKCDKWENTQT